MEQRVSFINIGYFFTPVLIVLISTGCSNSGADADNQDAAKIRAIENSIEEWKRKEESGEWQQMIKDGVAIEEIGDNSFNSKLTDFPKFKIDELEKSLEKLKTEPYE